MYTKATSLPNLYIRNIIPEDVGIPLLEYLVISGRPHANFGDARLLMIMLRDMNFAFWAFSEVRFKRILGNLGKFTEVPGRVFSDVRMYGVLRSSRQAEGGGIISLVGRVCTR